MACGVMGVRGDRCCTRSRPPATGVHVALVPAVTLARGPSELLEIRTYRLRPDAHDAWTTAMKRAPELLEAFGIDVVRWGVSTLDDAAEAFLIRSFIDEHDRSTLEDLFYNSNGWKLGPREALLDTIVDYHTIAIQVEDESWARAEHQ